MSDTAKRIAELEKELAESINGYISRKVIKGKERFYLQWTENGKLKSRYIKAGELEQTRALVERRKSLQAELKKLNATPDGVKSYNLKRKAVQTMRIFAELSWLWKGLGISLLSSAVGVGLVWAVCRARKKPINKPAAVITGAAAFAASIIVLLLLSQTPKTI